MIFKGIWLIEEEAMNIQVNNFAWSPERDLNVY